MKTEIIYRISLLFLMAVGFFLNSCFSSDQIEFKSNHAGTKLSTENCFDFRYDRFKVGEYVSEIELENAEGKIQRLSEVASKNKLTLILFWASWSHKYELEFPQIAETYEKYHPHGFEILAVSLDQDKTAWEKSLIRNKCDWINLCDFNQWNSEIIKDYEISP